MLQLLSRDLLHEVPEQGRVAATAELADRLASFGERLSARLFAAALEKRGVLHHSPSALAISSLPAILSVMPSLIWKRLRNVAAKFFFLFIEDGLVPVVTGFIGATPDGRITTLGRNSSDFSGAIIAHVVDAEELVIWTDVDGIFTDNPHLSSRSKASP